ncbi:MAG TPA: DUF58 domain-containing protein, partial [Pseudomonas sp.]|nr:DUF58 domain-containing protein [Pseudomonas sp.]
MPAGMVAARWCSGCCARYRRSDAATRTGRPALRLLPRFRDRWLLQRIPPA